MVWFLNRRDNPFKWLCLSALSAACHLVLLVSAVQPQTSALVPPSPSQDLKVRGDAVVAAPHPTPRTCSRNLHSLLPPLSCPQCSSPPLPGTPELTQTMTPLQLGRGQVWSSRVPHVDARGSACPETHARGKGRETASHGWSCLVAEAAEEPSRFPEEAPAGLGGALLPRRRGPSPSARQHP